MLICQVCRSPKMTMKNFIFCRRFLPLQQIDCNSSPWRHIDAADSHTPQPKYCCQEIMALCQAVYIWGPWLAIWPRTTERLSTDPRKFMSFRENLIRIARINRPIFMLILFTVQAVVILLHRGIILQAVPSRSKIRTASHLTRDEDAAFQKHHLQDKRLLWREGDQTSNLTTHSFYNIYSLSNQRKQLDWNSE